MHKFSEVLRETAAEIEEGVFVVEATEDGGVGGRVREVEVNEVESELPFDERFIWRDTLPEGPLSSAGNVKFHRYGVWRRKVTRKESRMRVRANIY